jgi:hypothetical protein
MNPEMARVFPFQRRQGKRLGSRSRGDKDIGNPVGDEGPQKALDHVVAGEDIMTKEA